MINAPADSDTSLPEAIPQGDGYIYHFTQENKKADQSLAGGLILCGMIFFLIASVHSFLGGIFYTTSRDYILPGIGLFFFLLAFLASHYRKQYASGTVEYKNFQHKYSTAATHEEVILYEIRVTGCYESFKVPAQMFHALEESQRVDLEYDLITRQVVDLKIHTSIRLTEKSIDEKLKIENLISTKTSSSLKPKHLILLVFGLPFLFLLLMMFFFN